MANEVTIHVKAKDDASKAIKGIESNTKKMAGSAKVAWGLAGTAVGKFIGDTIMKSSDLNETMNKSEVIFGSHAQEMTKWASGAAKNLGLSKQKALEASSSFALMFQQLGSTGGESVKLSKQVVQLATDLGSFHNLDTADVLERISAGFRGEYDSLQQLVPTISAARVEKEALATTGKKNADALTAEEKAMATLKIITEDSAAAQDDFKETAGGLANTLKTLKARFEDWQGSAAGQEQLAQMAEDATTLADAFFDVTEALDDMGSAMDTNLPKGGNLSEMGDAWLEVKARILGYMDDIATAGDKLGLVPHEFAVAVHDMRVKADKEMAAAEKKWRETQAQIAAKPLIAKFKAEKKDLDSKIRTAKHQLADPKLTATKRAKLEAKIDRLIAQKRKAQQIIDSLRGKTVDLVINTVRTSNAGGSENVFRETGPRAMGGPVSAAASGGPRGNQVLVGERGPEVVTLPTGSYVSPNGNTQQMLANGARGGNVNITINAPGVTDTNGLRRMLVDMHRRGELDVVLR